MVQKEVLKKTKTYGLIALLLAIVLVAMIYAYGNPGISPAAPQQPGSSQAAQTLGTQTLGTQTSMKTFNSYDELKNYLNQSSSSNLYSSAHFMYTTSNEMAAPAVPAPSAAPSAASATSQGATNDYSTTNIQVAGVDEADTVKTDGQYIYVIGNNSQAVYILDASSQNPQNAKVLSKISFDNGSPMGIYLSADGNELAVLGSNYIPYQVYGRFPGLYPANIMFPSWTTSTNFVYVYDVSDKSNPVLSRNLTMSGSYVDSRMIGNYVYDLISENAYLLNGTVLLPTVFSGQGASTVAPTNIYYVNTSDSAYMYTTIAALNIENAQEQAVSTTILMGNAGSIYVSQSNIYLTDEVSTYQSISTTTTQTGTTIMPMPIMPLQLYSQGTEIYRIAISGSSFTLAAAGNVTGTVMNQYSMDEYNGYFRIATTSYDYSSTSYTSAQQNNLYILDSNLQVVGKIENLASGEELHSARFIADRCYLVTFNQIDPLFVVDLTQPTNPMVLGNLTIPGYSDFLQPYDATHLIGIGQDVNVSIDANKVEIPGDVYYTAVLGLKVSLFDVSNVANPKETSNIVIGDSGTTSEALTDPKAILFDASRNLLVLPVELYLSTNSTTTASPGATGTAGNAIAIPAPAPTISTNNYYPQFVWQGVYIFNVDLTNGITIKGNITQLDNASTYITNSALAITGSYPWGESQYFIDRSLYIGNVLYTVSQNRVQLNSLSDFSLLAKVNLN
jgi:inhibitor of cysteine peptidase